jgi:lipopolysaccharide export system ATP-binding protein
MALQAPVSKQAPPHGDGAEPPPRPRLVAKAAGLEARALGKRFKGRSVLRDVDLEVRRGEAVGLLGPNGAGKTTCFYIITGLLQADQGTVCLDGVDITDLPMYRRARLGIGYLPQEASIFRGLSVEANVRAVLEVVEPAADRREAQLEQLLAEFSLTHIRRAAALELSGGERRRVEIARSLVLSPYFLLLDEPFAGIDPIAVLDIQQIVRRLASSGIGVLVTDHNVRETLSICDRAYIIHGGEILRSGTPLALSSDAAVRKIYLGESFRLH